MSEPEAAARRAGRPKTRAKNTGGEGGVRVRVAKRTVGKDVATMRRMIDPKLLEILACPQDKQPLEDHGDYLVNPRLGRAYPVSDGIPVLLTDEAVDWPLAEA